MNFFQNLQQYLLTVKLITPSQETFLGFVFYVAPCSFV